MFELYLGGGVDQGTHPAGLAITHNFWDEAMPYERKFLSRKNRL